jgi:hypothetical protein
MAFWILDGSQEEDEIRRESIIKTLAVLPNSRDPAVLVSIFEKRIELTQDV